MLLGARQFFEARKSTPLPYDAEVEYLQGDGNAYIDTGLTPARGSTVKLDGMVGFATGSMYRRFVYSDGNASVAHYSEFNADGLFGTGGAYAQIQLSPGVMYAASTTIASDRYDTEIEVDGVTYTASTTSFSSSYWGDIILFRLNNSYRGAGQRLGRTKIYVNDELKFDFQPVRFTNELGVTEGAMYDRVSGQLFRNAGTGNFSYGADK